MIICEALDARMHNLDSKFAKQTLSTAKYGG